jgi:phosphoglycerate dehydrogenase-like enzyme
MGPPFPSRELLTIGFAHPAYRLGESFASRDTGIDYFEVRTLPQLESRIGGADVLVVSGLWRNELAAQAPRLRFIQSISAGVDQFSRAELRGRGIRLASAQGVNERAVAEHAIALILALARQLPAARDNQARCHWRGLVGDPSCREDELGGKTLLIVGLGRIGRRLAELAKAFDLRVTATRRDPSAGRGPADAVHGSGELLDLVPAADFVVLTCPLTAETERLVDARVLAAMKPSAYLINVARGRCVDEPALIAALLERRIAAAALDCVVDEPLPASSPLWRLDNVLITPHSAGETRRYESNVLDLLIDNLDRLWRGEQALRNQVI